jgi:hypothetical protein
MVLALARGGVAFAPQVGKLVWPRCVGEPEPDFVGFELLMTEDRRQRAPAALIDVIARQMPRALPAQLWRLRALRARI